MRALVVLMVMWYTSIHVTKPDCLVHSNKQTHVHILFPKHGRVFYSGHVSDEIPNLTWCKDGEGEEEREGERVHCWC